MSVDTSHYMSLASSDDRSGCEPAIYSTSFVRTKSCYFMHF